MAWTGLTLTVEGRNALNQAQIANRINFKSIVVGDGKAPANFRTLKELVHQLYEITDIKVDMTEEGCTVTADFPKVDYDYYFREIGIIVTTDEGDKLYVYDNCGEDAQYMVSSTGVETTKKRIRLALTISDVEEITVSTAEILYVVYDDYENTIKNLKQDLQEENERAQTAEETNKNNLASHIDNKENPHKVTKVQVGLGNVDNTSDIDKPISTAQQEAMDRHTGNNAVHITAAERTNWNDANTKKHTHSNKGVLDKITQALLDNWNAAYTHISDAVKHITSAERTLWNTVSNKVDKVSGKGLSTNDYTTAEKNKLAGIAANANNYAHPTTAGNKHIPSGGSNGKILRWSADGTAVWGDDNDAKVTQTNTTASADTRLLLSNNANGTTETGGVKKSDNFLANPATGEFYAKGYRRIDISGSTLDINTLTLSAGCPTIMRYIEKTDGGSSKITNIPITGKPFLLDVELIRWASTSDYITMQTFRNASDYTHEYVRICTNGTWTAWQKRIFTDTNTTYNTATQSANGLLSAADKKKLDGISEGANKTIVDSSINPDSVNPVQNKVVKYALDVKANINHSHNNIRQILTVTTGKTITISCPIMGTGSGGVVIADHIFIKRLVPGYSRTLFVIEAVQSSTCTITYTTVYGGVSASSVFYGITTTASIEDGVLKTTITSSGYTSTNGMQLEYTTGITTVAVN